MPTQVYFVWIKNKIVNCVNSEYENLLVKIMVNSDT